MRAQQSKMIEDYARRFQERNKASASFVQKPTEAEKKPEPEEDFGDF